MATEQQLPNPNTWEAITADDTQAMTFCGPSEETCPTCGHVHRGEGVKVVGRDAAVRWHGCMLCWATAMNDFNGYLDWREAQGLARYVTAPAS